MRSGRRLTRERRTLAPGAGRQAARHSARLRGQSRNPYLWQDALRRLRRTNYLSATSARR